MLHEITGHNFHGHYHLTLRGPAQGFVLSPAQVTKYNKALCGVQGCNCGGGYGDGPDERSADVFPAVLLQDYEAGRDLLLAVGYRRSVHGEDAMVLRPALKERS
jgi:hypothetical protein